MSSIKIICPLPSEIPDIGTATCFQDFGQIQKAGLQRQYSAAGTLNTIAAAPILLLATWTALLAAADNTKVQVTPEIENPTFEPGAARTTGGGNATLGGINKKIGTEVTTAEFMLNAYNQSIIADLKLYMRELALGIWLFNEHGQIGCLADDVDTPTTYYPIPIARRTFFIGDKKFGGLEEEDSNLMQFEFAANWSDRFAIVDPTDFNPLVDLTNP